MIIRRDDLREHLLPRLRAWRRHDIHIGLSPRVSPAWSGLLYREPHGAITEYATMFATAAIHVDSRHVPDPATAARLRRQTHEDFGWAVIVEDDAMMYRFSHGHAERHKRGALNPHFLDPRHITGTIAPLLHSLEPHVSVVLLNVGPVYRTETLRADRFLGALTDCLDALPVTHRYAVEIANPEFVLPEYLECLHQRNVAHVPSGTPLLDAIRTPGALGANICVVRSACLGEEGGEEWAGFQETVRRCLEEGRTLYAYLGDGSGTGGRATGRGEGAVRLVQLLAGLDSELAQRSPIRRRAA